jgi:hypothetical protein
MTIHETHASTTAPAIPRPRGPQPDATGRPAPKDQPDRDRPAVPEQRAGTYPWPEPWHYSRAARPRSEFWDVATASWRSRGPYPDRSANS